MDESGDLGFDKTKRGTSRNFVITFLFTTQRRPVEKIIKKTFSKLPNKVQKNHPGCLHATKEKDKTRIMVLKYLNNLDVFILTITLNKSKVHTRLRNEKHLFSTI